MSGYVHVHVTELGDPGGIVECTWATGLELARAALNGTPRQPPATAAEREALRIAGGGSDIAGANYLELAAGCQRRYGWSPAISTALPAAPGPGTFLGVQGRYSALPAHYRRWDPAFGGGHSAVVYNLDGTLEWCDPLAPPSVRDPKGGTIAWQGEPIEWGVVAAYFRALPGAQVAAARLNVPPPAPAPQLWLVTVTQRTPVYAAASTSSRVLGYYASRSVKATRSMVSGRWWYRVTSSSGGLYLGGFLVADGSLTARRI
jgi:hypothetical protein